VGHRLSLVIAGRAANPCEHLPADAGFDQTPGWRQQCAPGDHVFAQGATTLLESIEDQA